MDLGTDIPNPILCRTFQFNKFERNMFYEFRKIELEMKLIEIFRQINFN